MSFLFAEKTRPELTAMANDDTLIVVPVGSTEQHALHLPVGTDTLLVERLVHRAAADADAAGLPVLVTPTLPVGFSRHHIPFGGTLSISQDTLVKVLTDIGASLATEGYRRVVFINGHGGNSTAAAMATTELTAAYKHCLFACCDYWNLAKDRIMADRDSAPGGMGHACEFETALCLAFAEQLVDMEKAVPAIPAPRIPGELHDLLQKGPVAMGLDWKRATATGALGDPTLADREKGERWASWLAEAIRRTMEYLIKAELPPVENA